MWLALGDVLAVEMGQGVNQVGVVQQHRAVGTDGQGIFALGAGEPFVLVDGLLGSMGMTTSPDRSSTLFHTAP